MNTFLVFSFLTFSLASSPSPSPSTGTVPTPHGFAPQSCVYHLPNHAALHQDGSVTLNAVGPEGIIDPAVGETVQYPPCTEAWTPTWIGHSPGDGGITTPPATINNWETEVQVAPDYFPSGYRFTEISASYTVPATPRNDSDGQTIYIFPEVQDIVGDVVQPCLVDFGDGSGWQLAPLYFGTTVQGGNGNWKNWWGPMLSVSPGDSVQVLAEADWPLGWWYERVYDATTGEESDNAYQVYNDYHMITSYPTALEVYNVNYCEDLPYLSSGVMTFSNIDVYDGSEWYLKTNVDTTSTWTPGWDTSESPDCYFWNGAFNDGSNFSDSMSWCGGTRVCTWGWNGYTCSCWDI